MEKEFVNYNQALKLKALGFNEHCLAWYDINNILFSDITIGYEAMDSRYIQEDMNAQQCTAPTFSQAFRWFRDKNFYAKIESYHSLGNHKPFGLSIDYLHESGKWTYIDHGGDFDFQTHEEAQERAIEIIIGILEK